jgi:two-component system, chemotaxis family, chemotaxis protein CheY
MIDQRPFKRKICIVDDDISLIEIYKIKLEEDGFDVITAEDGEQGLVAIKQEKPDLALVDLNMPNKNGIEMMEEIRRDKDLSRIKIIILTNYDDMDTVKKIEKYNASFYIVKANATPQKVSDMVKEALEE